MDNGSQTSLTLQRQPEGGYVVMDSCLTGGTFCQTHYACTTIEEALKFIDAKIRPIASTENTLNDDFEDIATALTRSIANHKPTHKRRSISRLARKI